jgi:hypothetical protein
MNGKEESFLIIGFMSIALIGTLTLIGYTFNAQQTCIIEATHNTIFSAEQIMDLCK